MSVAQIGFQISVAGGYARAVERAIESSCTTIQVFSRNPRQWKCVPIQQDDACAFMHGLKVAGISPVFVHMPYLINLASQDRNLRKRSLQMFIEDLKRTRFVGGKYLIMHVGSSPSRDRGIERMIEGINKAFRAVRNNVILLLENTPGSGRELGDTFADIQFIRENTTTPERLGLVFDTAHAYAAGYPLDTVSGVNETIQEIDATVGINNLYLLHLNDSKTICGARYDRHEHIGKGKIGPTMRHIVNHPKLRGIPIIMETPRTSVKDDLRNLKTVMRYRKQRKNLRRES